MANFRSATATGLEGLIAALEKFPGEAEKAIRAGMLRSEEQIMGESKNEIPVATGRLQSGAFAPLPSRHGDTISVVFGYYAEGNNGGPYAEPIHRGGRLGGDVLRVGKTGGYSPKGRKYPAGTWSAVGKQDFLSDPFDRHVDGGQFIGNLRTELTAALKRTVGKKHS